MTGVLPVSVLVSFVLRIPCAHLTHEGCSTGDPAARSHNWFGRPACRFSFGLSMHRDHHPRPHLAWIELRRLVERDPERRRIPRRDIWREAPPQAV